MDRIRTESDRMRFFGKMNSMKKTIFKTLYAVVVFLVALFVTDRIMNRAGSDLTAEMSHATFPLVYVTREGQRFNCMHGKILETEPAFVCSHITPVDAVSRTIDFEMDTYGGHLESIAYEVRDTSGERLVENGILEDYDTKGGKVNFSLTLKDLLEVGEEYILRLEVGMSGKNGIYFDTRISLQEDIAKTDEAIRFAMDFSRKTFDKEEARELTTYLESNEEGDNTTFARVDIHSSFSQITWGLLEVRQTKEPDIEIERINPYVSSIRLTYPLELKNGVNEEEYNISEYFYMRFGTERMYLLDYQRQMNSVFNPHNAVFSNNKISLGITDPDALELTESEDGNTLAFVKENSLYSFNTADNKTARVFSFYDEDNNDERDMYDGNRIKILNIDESGNIRFMVCGYMNRGVHEGGIGITCYYYNSVMNTVEEEVYIPFYTSEEYLKQGIGKLAYVNSMNKLFLLIDNKLYRVDLVEKTFDVMEENLTYGRYQVSGDNHLLAYEESREDGKAASLKVINFSNGRISKIESPQGHVIRALGFVGEDLVYGIASENDALEDEFGNQRLLLSTVMISDENGNALKTYEKPGVYVTDAAVTQEQIKLTRVNKNGSGQITPAEDDYIMSDAGLPETKNVIEVVATQNLEKVVQIAIKASLSGSKMKLLTPKQVMYEGQRQLFLSDRDSVLEGYYVYDAYGLYAIHTEEKDALLDAELVNGRVLDHSGRCLWEKSSRGRIHQIADIDERKAESFSQSIAFCLEALLKKEGISIDCSQLLQRGVSIGNILEKNLPGSKMLDLRGCSMESVLYFVERDRPVMALLNDGSAVLIVGFNELNTIIYNPMTGQISKMGMNDSQEFFAANGNRFITYQ